MYRVSGDQLRSFAPRPHFKDATIANRWQRVCDLIGLEFKPHISRITSRRFTTTWPWASVAGGVGGRASPSPDFQTWCKYSR